MTVAGDFLALTVENETGDDLVDHFHIDVRHGPNGSITQINGGRLETWTREPRHVGIGGFGTAWLEQGSTGKLRVVKQVRKALPNSKTEYWLRELSALALLSKNRIFFPHFYGWYQDSDHVYIAMEYFALGDLGQCVTSPVAEEQSQLIVAQVTAALVFMHRKRITHRDLKPANLLVRIGPPSWRIAMADFGVSKRVRDASTVLHTSFDGDFMAPEVLGFVDDGTDGEYTNAVDLWSLGCLTYWLLTNQLPVPRNRLMAHCSRPWQHAVAKIDLSNISSTAQDFILPLLKPDPKDRTSIIQAKTHPWLDATCPTIELLNTDASYMSNYSMAGGRHSAEEEQSELKSRLDEWDLTSLSTFSQEDMVLVTTPPAYQARADPSGHSEQVSKNHSLATDKVIPITESSADGDGRTDIARDTAPVDGESNQRSTLLERGSVKAGTTSSTEKLSPSLADFLNKAKPSSQTGIRSRFKSLLQPKREPSSIYTKKDESRQPLQQRPIRGTSPEQQNPTKRNKSPASESSKYDEKPDEDPSEELDKGLKTQGPQQSASVDAAVMGARRLTIHSYEARSPDEISIQEGDLLHVIETDEEFGDGWYLGRNIRTGNTGLFPVDRYTTNVPPQAAGAAVVPAASAKLLKQAKPSSGEAMGIGSQDDLAKLRPNPLQFSFKATTLDKERT